MSITGFTDGLTLGLSQQIDPTGTCLAQETDPIGYAWARGVGTADAIAIQFLIWHGDETSTGSKEPRTTSPVGRKGTPLNVPQGTNESATINGTGFSGHAIDKLQSDGIPPSAALDAIRNGETCTGRGNTTISYSRVNNVSVVQNAAGKVIAVTYGKSRGD